MWQALIEPIAGLGTQFLANRKAAKDNAARLAQLKIDRKAAKDKRDDDLEEVKVRARINRIENEQTNATSLDSQQLQENREGKFDEWYISLTILAPFVFTMCFGMYQGVVTGEGPKAMWDAFKAAPKYFWYANGAVLAFRILALRAMFRWGVRLWISMKGGNVSLPGEGKAIPARDSKGKEKAVTDTSENSELDKPEDLLAAKRKDEQ